MIYEVRWAHGVGPRATSRFATWDGKVVDASSVLRWAMGHQFETVRIRLVETYGARIQLVQDSHTCRTVDGRP